jgi:2-polyprenyl-6-methoxyphenol hydroxylase-like FAD-dependent oxidoreductase
MKILIVGGGVAGPALAQFLKNNAEITLVDKAPAWGNIGYAISLWGNGQKILNDLGLENKILKRSYQLPWNAFEDKKGKVLSYFLMDIFKTFGPTIIVSRFELQQALVNKLEEKINIKMNATVLDLQQDSSGVSVTFSDNTRDHFDLVVGADGVHSKVRDLVFGTGFLKYYNWSIYVFWAPSSIVPPNGVIQVEDDGRYCFICPIEDKAVTMLAVYSKERMNKDKVISKEFLHDKFSSFSPLIKEIIDSIPDTNHILKDEFTYVAMKDWYKGRVALMGDAKHAHSPLLGMGASMALEDAYVLAEELKKVDKDNISIALDKYAKRRERRVSRFHKHSTFIEKWILVRSPILSFFRDLMLLVIPSSYFTNSIQDIINEEI